MQTSPGSMYRFDYGIHRWWSGPELSVRGAYFLIVTNVELFVLQENYTPHVVCVVDDFGDLVRKPK